MRIDIKEDGPSSGAHDGAGGGEETKGGSEDGVSWLDAGSDQRKPESIGSGGATDGVASAGESGDFAFEGLDFCAEDKVLGRANALKGGEDFGAQFGVLAGEVEQGNGSRGIALFRGGKGIHEGEILAGWDAGEGLGFLRRGRDAIATVGRMPALQGETRLRAPDGGEGRVVRRVRGRALPAIGRGNE